MKRIIITLAALLFSVAAYCGGSGDPLANAKYIKDTVLHSVTYKLYQGSKGGRFIVVTSKTGVKYRRYFWHK